MTRGSTLATAVVLLLTLGCSTPSEDGDEPTPEVADDPAGSTDGGPERAQPPETVPEPEGPDDPEPPADPEELPPGTTLVWTRGRLPSELIAAVAEHAQVAAVTVVEVASVGLERSVGADGEVIDELDDGWRLPLEALGVDPVSYAEVTGLQAAADLGGGRALLSESSAAVRRLSVGGRLFLADDRDHEVVGIVADELIGAAELLVASEDLPADAVDRYLLARPTPGAEDLAAALEGIVRADAPVRVRSAPETPVLRHADAVAAPARLKAAFGEFALRDAPGRGIEQDPGWIDEHVRTAEVPLLGQVTCHRAALAALEGAMDALLEQDAGDVVAPGDHAGCWVPRLQDEDGPLSAHAWGVAIDLDPAGLPQGSDTEPPEPLLEAMENHGFTNGAGWLLPDPMHFELVPDRDPS